MSFELWLLRHGETDWNRQLRMQGQKDIPLNERGIEQAQSLISFLNPFSFSKVYSSDLQRAHQTATLAINGRQPIQTLTELRERNFGILEGLNPDEMNQQYPDIYSRYKSKVKSESLQGGESIEQFQNRIEQCVHQLFESHSEEKVLAVTHGGVLDCMMRMTLKLSLETPRFWSIRNASLSSFTCTHGQWKLNYWGLPYASQPSLSP